MDRKGRLAAATVAAAITAAVAAAAAKNEHENNYPAAVSAEAIITHNFFLLSTIPYYSEIKNGCIKII